MKQKDFDRLKAVCEKEGFEILNLTHDDNEKYVLVKKQKERVKVIAVDFNKDSITFHYTGKPNKLITELASKLEEYLNKE